MKHLAFIVPNLPGKRSVIDGLNYCLPFSSACIWATGKERDIAH